MSDFVAGVDAGGTKTRAFVVGRTGEIVGRGAGGGANLLTSPDPQGSIAAALGEALAGRRPSAVVLSCAGGDRAAERERGRGILSAVVGHDVAIEVTHDAKAALYAGDRSGCGVVLIAAACLFLGVALLRLARGLAGTGADLEDVRAWREQIEEVVEYRCWVARSNLVIDLG